MEFKSFNKLRASLLVIGVAAGTLALEGCSSETARPYPTYPAGEDSKNFTLYDGIKCVNGIPIDADGTAISPTGGCSSTMLTPNSSVVWAP